MGFTSAVVAIGEICKEIFLLIQMYRQARAQGWKNEKVEILQAIGNATSDEDRKRLLDSLVYIVRQRPADMPRGSSSR